MVCESKGIVIMNGRVPTCYESYVDGGRAHEEVIAV